MKNYYATIEESNFNLNSGKAAQKKSRLTKAANNNQQSATAPQLPHFLTFLIHSSFDIDNTKLFVN